MSKEGKESKAGKESKVGRESNAGRGPASAEAAEMLTDIRQDLAESLFELQTAANLGPGKWLVVGASTSEIVGKRIGTATSLAVGEAVVQTVLDFASQVQCEVAFQCCEHLNRSLVVTRQAATRMGWSEVSAIPVPGAGGAVAAVAFETLDDACLVETMHADAGIDIGDTLIGMHLRRVAVPVRVSRTEIGNAHMTLARTRPPLVGGNRAVYDADTARERMDRARG